MAKGEDFGQIREVNHDQSKGSENLYRDVERQLASGVDSRYHSPENTRMINDQMASFRNGNLQPSEEYTQYRKELESKVYSA